MDSQSPTPHAHRRVRCRDINIQVYREQGRPIHLVALRRDAGTDPLAPQLKEESPESNYSGVYPLALT